TVYNETDTYRGWIQQARKFGFEGAFCIHPRQVEILNEEFLPSADEVAEAETLIKAFEAHKEKGIGAFTVDDRMVDAPVIDRARRILKRNHNRR
ncbi:MAG: hypothetical protein QGG64_14375, partial [Candidatus Latescibacteria bacterium]|nr:hypothetical protein [Candidatus Latescibacterota bacterium]